MPAAAVRITVLTGEGLASHRLARRLEAAGVAAERVRRYTLAQLVRQIYARLDRNPSVPAGGADALLRRVAQVAPDGYFTPILDRPGLRAALLDTFGEIALAG